MKGVRIDLGLRLHTMVIIFSVLWLGFGLAAGAVIFQIISTGGFATGMFIPIGMLLFYFLLMTIAFGVEANKARKLLSEIFNADAAL